MVFCRCGIAQRWRYRIHNDLRLFLGEIALADTGVQPEGAKPTAGGAIKLKLDICKAVTSSCYLPFFGCLPRAPSKECGCCLLTKFALAQPTAQLGFWRLGHKRILPLTSSTPCRRIRSRVAIRDQFIRPITHFLSHTRVTQQSRQPSVEPAALPYAPTMLAGHSVGAVEPSNRWHGEGCFLPRM